jgi:hypothetical protein
MIARRAQRSRPFIVMDVWNGRTPWNARGVIHLEVGEPDCGLPPPV